MAVSYKKLWKLLIDKDMKKKELEQQANLRLSPAQEAAGYDAARLQRQG